MQKQEDHEFEGSLSYTFKRLAVVSAPEAEAGRVRGQLGPQNNVQNSRGYTEELCLNKQKQKKSINCPELYNKKYLGKKNPNSIKENIF